MKRVTGIGGVFLKAKDPEAMAAWYRHHLGIDIQDKDEAGLKFIKDFSLTFPNAPDRGGKISVDYGVYGVPETFFIGRDGRVAYKHVGPVTEELLTTQIERLRAAPTRPAGS